MGFTLGFRLHWLRQPGKPVACLTDRCFWSNDRHLNHPVEWRDGIVRCRGQCLVAGPGAVGAVIARPERNVGCLEGGGSAMYTKQALCPMAREALDDTVVIFNNRKYGILELGFGRTGAILAGLSPGGAVDRRVD